MGQYMGLEQVALWVLGLSSRFLGGEATHSLLDSAVWPH